MQKSSNALKAGIGYTLSNILIKGINFLALPLFSRLLTTEEFGLYNVFVSYESILYVIVGLAIHSSIRSANLDFKNKIDEYVSSVSLIYIINSFLLIFVGFVLKGPIYSLLQLTPLTVLLIVIYSFSTALITLYNNKISLYYEYKKYIIISFVNSVGSILLSLILILTLFNDKKEIGRLLGVTITCFSLSGYILYSFYKTKRPKYNKIYWRYAIKYSLPIVPHGISQVLLAQFDRIMIQQINGNTQAGIYSFAGNFKLILTIITDSIGTAWSTWFYERIDKKEYSRICKSAMSLCLLFLAISISLMTISPELIYLLGGEKYKEAIYVTIPMIIDAFVLFVYTVIVPSEYYAKKTKYIMVGTIIAAIINIITNYIFIRAYGYIAAAYTTLFAYLCYLFLHVAISKRLISFYIISIKWIIIFLTMIAVAGIITIHFAEMIIVRFILGLIIVAPIVVLLIIKNKELVHKVVSRIKSSN